MQRRERKGEENMRDWEGQVGGRTEDGSKERDTMIEGATVGLMRNLALVKFSVIHAIVESIP